jgi:hypothetical protein
VLRIISLKFNVTERLLIVCSAIVRWASWGENERVEWDSYLQTARKTIVMLGEQTWVVPYLRRLVAGFSTRWPWFKPWLGHVGFVTLEQVFSEYFGLPYQFALHHNHHHLSSRGWYSRPISGRRTKWTHCQSLHIRERQSREHNPSRCIRRRRRRGIFLFFIYLFGL